MNAFKIGLFIVIAAGLSGCATTWDAVSDSPVKKIHLAEGQVLVKPKDTVYSLARRVGMNYKELARINHLDSAYHIHVGQILNTQGNSPALIAQPMETPWNKSYRQRTKPKPLRLSAPTALAHYKPAPVQHPAAHSRITWLWPTEGPLLSRFKPTQAQKGIDIGGNLGQPVRAAGDGIVMYSNRKVRGYGNLIIIKHDDHFLSTYAHNRKNLVQVGQWIKAGEIIAEMGSSDAHRVQLHFEIRHSGRSVNPLIYLPKIRSV